jgi:hypothetical protein
MSKDAFLYQINFNRKKYPEICKRLDEAKSDLGVAWYLRELILKDVQEREGIAPGPIVNVAESQDGPQIETKPIKETKESMKDILPDDNGGFI